MALNIRKKLAKLAQPTNASRASSLVFVPIAIGQIIASLETLSVSHLYKRDAVLRGVSARNATPGTARRRILETLDAPRTPLVLAGMNLVASGVLLVSRRSRGTQIVASTAIAACNRLSELRTPYGRDGADQMTSVVTQYRMLSALIPGTERSDDLFLRAVNLQASLSYLASGVSKMFGSRWVQGDALGEILGTEVYGGSPVARILKRFPRTNRLMTWATPIWEASFPLIFLLPRKPAHAALAGVKVFHLAVAAVMELPRFVWGFFGSHGAVKYVLDRPVFGTRKWTGVEASTVGAATAAVLVSATYAATTRRNDILRRRGFKGGMIEKVVDGEVEYKLSLAENSQSSPTVILECGLGSSLESWHWVAEELAMDCNVVTYHRSGYGLTTSRQSSQSILESVLESVSSAGPLICVTHSIGMLSASKYADEQIAGRKLDAIVVVDGTDPDVLNAEQKDRTRLGAFLQTQLHTLFVSFMGVYNFAPNAVSRQSAYPPDQQTGNLQFAFTPRNTIQSVREYLASGNTGALGELRKVPVRRLVASQEFASQQKVLADKLDANYTLVQGASHRSILGRQEYAAEVVREVRKTISDV